MNLKRCPCCERELSPTKENFNKDKQKNDGLCTYCKSCSREKNRRRIHGDNYEAFEAKKRHLADLKAQGLRECLTCNKAKPATLEYFRKNPSNETIGLDAHCKDCRKKQWADMSPQKRAEIKRLNAEWARKNRAAINARKRSYYHKTPSVFRKRSLEWQRDNPLKVRAREARRRARLTKAEGNFTKADIKLQYKSQRGRCWWCQSDLEEQGYHIDHLVPLVQGGSNKPENLVLACPSCNCSKGGKMPHEWGDRLL